MRKLPVCLVAIALIVVGIASAVGIGYQKVNDEGISGHMDVIASQAIGVHSINFIGWTHQDDSSIGVVSEDGFSYEIGLQINNGDEYDNENQYIEISFNNIAKTDIVVKLSTEFSVTKPDNADKANNDIHIFYEEKGCTNTIGQIDPWNYLVKIKSHSQITQEFIGIGDGVSKMFNLENYPVEQNSISVYIDGVKVDQSKYSIDYSSGIITFFNPPLNQFTYSNSDIIIDADGFSTNTWGIITDVEVSLGDILTDIEWDDYILTNNLNNPKDVWYDSDDDQTYDHGENIILGSLDDDDPGVNVAIDPRWVFYDTNFDGNWDDGEDIIFEGDSEITADYSYSGTQIRMHVDVGNTVVPGFYTFTTYLEPTFFNNLDTINMN